GLSMPVGFKNSTDGNVQPAIDAVMVAASEHWFPGVTKQGVSALFHTTGNRTCHVILRGGSTTGPNYHAAHVDETCARLAARDHRPTLMVDCSHGNSLKNPRRQADVAAAIAAQVASGSRQIFGAMIESHLVEGRQDFAPGQALRYGQSITDACLAFEATEPLLEHLARAHQARQRAAVS
ncbi:MAG: 3-deoxy-7-phosphoheptulonate synthase, partial [Acidobacteriota bacterium]|nr:3-deoxy-7-phosphoheptulonate synthase [Acidobacteriota bacterium]